MLNHTKEYSIAVITHAIEKLRFEGRQEKEISTLLGIDPSNISKYKSGDSKLSPTNLNILIEEFGPPKLAAGRYLQACVYNTVADYIAAYEAGINRYFMSEFKLLLTELTLQDELASNITGYVLSAPSFPSKEIMTSLMTACSRENKQAIIDWLITQTRTSEFQKWSKEYEASVLNLVDHTNLTSLPCIRSFIPVWAETEVNAATELLIYGIGQFAMTNKQHSKSWNELISFTENEQLQQIVLTGKPILELTPDDAAPVLPKTIDVFRKLSKPEFWCYSYHKIQHRLQKLGHFSVDMVKITLFMNEQMQYRILIEENWAYKKKTTIIKNVRADLVVEQVNTLASFYRTSTGYEHNLKAAIASRGGYIPGAEIL